MVSSDDEIAEYVLKIVDAFVPKNEVSSRLLPEITRICSDSARVWLRPESRAANR
jgi:hypothetical protein